jgi:excisionase family DNA binding protein
VEEFLTVAEIAETLKLNQQTVRNWIDDGQLPAVRIGARRVRVRRSDFDALVGGGRPSAEPPKPASPSSPTVPNNLWERLEAALSSDLPDQRRAELADALRTFAEAATHLVQLLERPPGSEAKARSSSL